MSQSLEQEIQISSASTALSHATLTIGPDSWSLYIFAITRIGRYLFIQMTLLGPRECTVTVRTPDVQRGVTARQILNAVCDWLLSGDRSDRAFLEISSGADSCEPWC